MTISSQTLLNWTPAFAFLFLSELRCETVVRRWSAHRNSLTQRVYKGHSSHFLEFWCCWWISYRSVSCQQQPQWAVRWRAAGDRLHTSYLLSRVQWRLLGQSADSLDEIQTETSVPSLFCLNVAALQLDGASKILVPVVLNCTFHVWPPVTPQPGKASSGRRKEITA